MKFTVYNQVGEIVRWGECPDDALELQACHEGEGVIEGHFDAQTQYWDGYAMQAKVPDLTLARAAKWEQIKAARSSVEFGGFSCGGLVYDSDPVSVQRITGAVTMAMLAQGAGQAFAITWTLADNSTTTLDAAGMIAVGEALGAFVAAAHECARQLRAQIDAATTIEEVGAIAWPPQ